MANQTDLIQLSAVPLASADAAALRSDWIPRLLWSPTLLLETDIDDVATPTLLAAAGDLWKIQIAPQSAIPGYVWQCITFELQVLCNDDANFDAFFADTVAFGIQGFPASATYYPFYRTGTLSAVARSLNSGGVTVSRSRSFSSLPGLPSRPYQATSASLATNSMAVANLQVGTFDATVQSNTQAWINARWLGYPQAAARSGGYYLPNTLGVHP